MLLALQTTTDALDESTLDAVTVVLLAAFVVSLIALAMLLNRRAQEPPEDDFPALSERRASGEPAEPAIVRPEPRPIPASKPQAPAWLGGVSLPIQSGSRLAAATTVIEELLEARQSGALDAGVALLSAAHRGRLADELGVQEDALAEVMRVAQISGEGPVLRSVELVSAQGAAMSIRATYMDRTAETYRLIWSDGSLLIDAIDRA